MKIYNKSSILIFGCYFLTLTSGFRCVLNPYYKPICGSDNGTYGNHDILNCFNSMRPFHKRVKVVSHQECRPLICPSYQDLLSFWPSPPNSKSTVCTNSGFTMDIHQVRCLKDFHTNLEIKHEGGCTVYELRRALGRNRKRKACAEKRRYFEDNPICLSNNVTLLNPFQALCEYPKYREKAGGKCGCPIQRSCQRAELLLQSLKISSHKERIKFAVCGSNRKTYRSEDHLECARRYNSHLYLLHKGECKNIREPCPEKLKQTRISNPVCGSDNKSYINFDAFICAQTRINQNLKYVHSGACVTTL